MARIALLGGSFDPPHVGHQMLCLWALSTDRADVVWLVPTYAHALNKSLSPFESRCRMSELATGPFEPGRVSVSAVERTLPRPNRTLNLVRYMRKEYPQDLFILLIGSDLLAQRAQWYGFDEIEELVEVAAVARPGYERYGGAPVACALTSTAVRERAERGEDISELVPASVAAYIREEGVYERRQLEVPR